VQNTFSATTDKDWPFTVNVGIAQITQELKISIQYVLLILAFKVNRLPWKMEHATHAKKGGNLMPQTRYATLSFAPVTPFIPRINPNAMLALITNKLKLEILNVEKQHVSITKSMQ
jgi:hypothetical protein